VIEWLIPLVACGILIAIAVRAQRKIVQLEERVFYAEKAQRDLLPRTQLAEQIRDSLLQAAPEGILIMDDVQRILYMNAAAGRLLGAVHVDDTLMAAARDSELDRLVRESRRKGVPEEARLEFNQYHLYARVTPVDTLQGGMTLLLLLDETELHRLGRARREMVANISHELRTPVTTINLMVETLIDDLGEKNKRVRKMLKDIQRQTATLIQLIQEMRDLSLIESGQMPIKLMPANVQTMVQSSMESLMSIAESKEQLITVDVAPELVALADAGKVERVLKNILHNAIKFTPQRGKITVRAQADEDEIKLQITDTGTGISPVNLSRIFERFFQENLARTDGTGLGLAIARHIILAHGGQIWVESAPGSGSTFYFTLHRAETALVVNET
jgi:two-component system, OmpR family, phosphate regulon sensor histidine kinase PhoR